LASDTSTSQHAAMDRSRRRRRLDAQRLLRQLYDSGCTACRSCRPVPRRTASSINFAVIASAARSTSPLCDCCLRLPSAHTDHPLHHLRQALCIRLYSSSQLGLDFSLFPPGPVLPKSWAFGLDAPVVVVRRWHFHLLETKSPGGLGIPRRNAGFLLTHCLLSRLGRNFILRQSLFRFAHARFRCRFGGFPGSPRKKSSIRALSLRSNFGGHDFRSTRLLHLVEPRLHVSVGNSPGSRARPDLLARNDRQSIYGRTSPDFRESWK